MPDFTVCTAAELVDLYQKGSASPVTVTEQILNKIDQLNPVLNAFCYLDPDTTLQQARNSEQRWQQHSPLSKLDGVPFAVKDSILTQGWPTLQGSLTVDPVQDWLEDAPVTARLRAAGAILIGKTTMPEFGVDNHSSNSQLYGITRNPWNTKHTPGGSSGGSAVAVAAGMVPVALGSDFGGSIAVPAAFCGVYGMKPSFGRVARYPSDTVDLTTIGPMARSVQDLTTALEVISGPDVRDWASLPDGRVDHNFSTNQLRVAYCQDSVTTSKIAQRLSDQGAMIGPVDFDVDIDEAMQIMKNINIPELFQKWQSIPEDRRPLTSNNIQRWAILSHSKIDLYHWIDQRKKLIVKFREFMQHYDAIICPVTAMSADEFLVDNMVSHKKDLFLSQFSVLACITKQPTVTVPTGLNSNSMPEAVQIIGPMHGDALTLQIASAIESAFPMPAGPLLYGKSTQ
jgi:aspartyl-tRNA(Asn)/glutamyl-tRNA(Gln) amidotransferase subunit A